MHEDTGLEFASRDRRRHARVRPRHPRRHARRRRQAARRSARRAAPGGWPSCSSPARRATTAPGTCSRTACSPRRGRRRRAGVDGLRHPPDAHHPVGDDRHQGPGRSWRRPTSSRSPCAGRGGHASMPHHASDPIPIACEIVSALQAMVTRRVDVFDPAVVTVAKIRAGTTSNVIPETADALRHDPHRLGAAPATAVHGRHRAAGHGHRVGPRRHRRGRAHPRLPGHGQRRRRRRASRSTPPGCCSARRPPSRCRPR